MKLRDLLKDVEVVKLAADADMEILGVSYDSRHTQPGDLFTAICGFESDGHGYIGSAMEKGAVAVLCQRTPETDCPYILVADSRLALALISRNFFGDPAEKMTMIGVTGTNGKTTSTLLIKHILEDCLHAKVGLVGTNSNLIGSREIPTERTTPESYELQRLFSMMYDEGCKYVVMEVSSHSLSLHRVAGIRFRVALFTNLTRDHLDFHGTMEKYAQAKAQLFNQSELGIINLDDDYTAFMRSQAKCEIKTYSCQSSAADFVAEDLRLLPDSVRFCAVTKGALARVNLGIPGRFSAYNALGAMSVGAVLGISLENCAEALSSAKGVKGRVETVPTDGDYTVLIDYAHTPDALENVLRTVREVTKGRVVALFGCGGDRDRTKRPIMGEIGTRMADFSVITSDNPRTEQPEAIIADILTGVKAPKEKYIVIPDRVEAITWAIDHHRDGDVIVLAGKGHETYQEINHVKHHMDEREIVAGILEKRKNK